MARGTAKCGVSPATILVVLLLVAPQHVVAPTAPTPKQEKDASVLQPIVQANTDLMTNTYKWIGKTPCTGSWKGVVCTKPNNKDGEIKSISLPNSGLSGGIPPLTELKQLDSVDLSGNQLNGTIPAMGPKMKYLNIANNKLSGDANLDALCGSKDIVEIIIAGNPSLTGTLPTCWGDQLPNIATISAANTGLTGTIPLSWDKLDRLRTLNLANTKWKPNPPSNSWPSWQNMEQLRELDLSASTGYADLITEQLPPKWFSGFKQMQVFKCSRCKWTQADDPRLGTTSWPLLVTLDVSQNPVTSANATVSGSAADVSSLSMNMTNTAVGGVATISCTVMEANGTARASTNGIRLLVRGSITGDVNYTDIQLEAKGAGNFETNYTAVDIESISAMLYVDGALAGTTTPVSIVGVLPTAVDTIATFHSLALQKDGEIARTTWTAADGTAVYLAGNAIHTLYMKVANLLTGGNLTKNPAMYVTLSLDGNGTSVTSIGSWSGGDAMYVIQFKLPLPGNYSGQLQLREVNASTTPFATKSLTFAVDVKPAAANRSSFKVVAPTAAGNALTIEATLKTEQGRTVFDAGNVQLQVTGSSSGVLPVGPLSHQLDIDLWTVNLTSTRAEALSISMTVGGQTVGTQSLIVYGKALSVLSINKSLEAATLVSGQSGVTASLFGGAQAELRVGDIAYLYVPPKGVPDNIEPTDSGLQVMISIVPSNFEAAIMQRYNLSSNVSGVSLQPSYVFNEPLSNTPNTKQNELRNETGVTTYKGELDASTHTYTIDFSPTTAGSYMAVLSVQHPNISNSFTAIKFRMAVMAAPPSPPSANPSSSSGTTTETSSAAAPAVFNPLANPQVSFTVAFPQLSAAVYPGGTALAVSDFKATVSKVAVLTGPEWVQAEVATATPLMIKATVWFSSTYATLPSPFQGVSAMDYYIFLLGKMPSAAFTSSSYPALVATNASVTAFTVALPGGDPLDGFTYGAAASTTTEGSADEAGNAGPAPPAVQIEDISDHDMQVVTPISDSSTGAPSPVIDVTPVKDTSAPVITLRGEPYVSVLQAENYVDSGATAVDDTDGNAVALISKLQLCSRPSGIETAPATDNRPVSCGAVLAAVNTTLPLSSNETYVFTYTARDAAGNQAAPLRRYVVVTARCPVGQVWCADMSTCSVHGLCMKPITTTANRSSATESAVSRTRSTGSSEYLPPADTTTPTLKLLGTGTAIITSTGASVMMDTVLWKSVWSDPGASAIDADDGDLSQSIQSYGAAAVDTSIATPPDKKFGFVVEYHVKDRYGNAAPIARRLIKVACFPGEAYCFDPETQRPTCTVNGQCGASQLLSHTTTTATSPTSQQTAIISWAPSTQPAQITPPRISLLVPGHVEIAAGEVYDRCLETSVVFDVCERGVLAIDAKDGNMERQVMVCGSKWRPDSAAKPVPLLLACGIKNNRPGTYNITFSVTNSAGLTASVNRRIVIEPLCPWGEGICSDKVTCSSGGSCVFVQPPGGSISTRPAEPVELKITQSAQSATAAVSTATAMAAGTTAVNTTEVPNQSPVISLRTTNNWNSVVRIRHSGTYEPCKEGVMPTMESPCEPGAEAYDPDGAISDGYNGAGGVLDMTGQVVVCPPARCLSQGCSPTELRQHYFSVKGLKGCGVNTSLSEGTQISIDYWIWDAGMPSKNASITRTVVIGRPCPDQSAPYLCSDLVTGQSYCSGMRCLASTKLLPAPKPRPKIELHPISTSTVYVAYGQPAPFHLGACISGQHVSGCGAVAWDEQSGQKINDLTPYIVVKQHRDDCADGQVCPSCDLAALSASGNCMPGKYTLTYIVTNNDDAMASVDRQVIIYQAASISARLTLYRNLTDAVVAEHIYAGLLDNSSQEFANGADKLLKALPTAVAQQLHPTDVGFTATDMTWNEADWFNIIADVSVYVYEPQGVHKKDVDAFQAALQDATGTAGVGSPAQRRMLTAAAPDSTKIIAQGQDDSSTPAYASDGVLGQQTWTPLQQGQQDNASWGSKLHTATRHVHKLLHMLEEHKSSSNCSLPAGCIWARGSAFGSRRLLQTESQLSSTLASINRSLADDWQASKISSNSLTEQDVDMIGAYVSALTSSVGAIEQTLVQLQGSGTALSQAVAVAFGEEAGQREAQSETGINTLYQGLVSEFGVLVTTVESLANQAAAAFDVQMSAAPLLALSMSNAITAMREATSMATTMQQKYLQQTLLASAATGQLVQGWQCNRTMHWRLHFNTSRSVNTTSASRRKLLAYGGSMSSSLPDTNASADSNGSSSTPLSEWNGYLVSLNHSKLASQQQPGAQYKAPGIGRYVGASYGRNLVIGGLFLHTTRKQLEMQQRTSGDTSTEFGSKYGMNCHNLAATLKPSTPVLANSTSTLGARPASQSEADSYNIHPYGVDPAFLRTSASLYRPELQGKQDWFYNTSNPLEVSPNKVPYGFFHRPIQGYPPGFPVLLPLQFSQHGAVAAMRYLMDGNYLDRQSKELTAELLTYNPGLEVIGYAKVAFGWEAEGVIRGVADVIAVPSFQFMEEFSDGPAWHDLGIWLTPTWILCAVFCTSTVLEARALVYHCEAQNWFLVLMQSTELKINLITSILMLVAAMVLTHIRIMVVPVVKPKPAYEVYDGAGNSKARMFMPAKAYSPAHLERGLASVAELRNYSSSNASADVLCMGWQPIVPGDAGRWLLPNADDNEWAAWADFLNGVQDMANLWAIYNLLQGIILVMLIFKLVCSLSFQSRLGIITNTLLEAAPQLAHLLLVIIMCIGLFAGLSYSGLGYRVSYVSGYAAALEETFRSLLGLGYIKLFDVVPKDIDQLWPQQLLCNLFYYGREVLFVMVLAQYFMATLGSTFVQLKRAKRGGKGTSIAQDIAHDVLPEVPSRMSWNMLGSTYSITTWDEDGAKTISLGAEGLHTFIKAYYPNLILKASEAKSHAIQIGARYFSLPVLQQLLADLVVSDSQSRLMLMQTRPAKRYARHAAEVTAAAAALSTTNAMSAASMVEAAGDAAMCPSNILLDDAGMTALAVGSSATAIAAALAAAEQLLSACGMEVDARELHKAQRILKHASQSQLKACDDYTVKELQAKLQREIELHRRIHATIWGAVSAMERWTVRVAHWQAQYTREINNWLSLNSQLLVSRLGPYASGADYVPIPAPRQYGSMGRATRETRTSDSDCIDVPYEYRVSTRIKTQQSAGTMAMVPNGRGPTVQDVHAPSGHHNTHAAVAPPDDVVCQVAHVPPALAAKQPSQVRRKPSHGRTDGASTSSSHSEHPRLAHHGQQQNASARERNSAEIHGAAAARSTHRRTVDAVTVEANGMDPHLPGRPASAGSMGSHSSATSGADHAVVVPMIQAPSSDSIVRQQRRRSTRSKVLPNNACSPATLETASSAACGDEDYTALSVQEAWPGLE